MYRKRGNEKAGVNKMNNKQEGNRKEAKGQMMEKRGKEQQVKERIK